MHPIERISHRSKTERKTSDKVDRATTNLVLDHRVRLILFKLINKGTISDVRAIINSGKEANVFLCTGGASSAFQGGNVALKVFATSIMAFKNRAAYIDGERRFNTLSHSQRTNSRRLVALWGDKEFRNLQRLYDLRTIGVPKPLFIVSTILATEFLGVDDVAAPRLRDVAPFLSDHRITKLYYSLLRVMRDMYQSANLVHGDLSEYNILYMKKRAFIIDVGQAVDRTHPLSSELLRMDIFNVNMFFARQRVPIVPCKDVLAFVCMPRLPSHDDYLPSSSLFYDAFTPRETTTSINRSLADSDATTAPPLDRPTVARLRYLHKNTARLFTVIELTTDRDFIDYRIFDSLSNYSILELDGKEFNDRTSLQALGIEDISEGDPESNYTGSTHSLDSSIEEGSVEDTVASKTLCRADYTKDQWKAVKDEQKAARRERTKEKVPKKVKKRAEVLAARKRRHK